MKTRIHRSKCILTALLSAAMVVWNVSAALPVCAAPAIEDFREDAELINDLVLPTAVQKKSRNRNASPSEATAAKERQALFAGAAGWGTPSSATKILRTELDGVAIDASAPAGVLPEGAVLKARRLTNEEEREVLNRISEHADTEGKTVTTQFLCDLTVFNAAGKAVQPDSSKGQLVVSFRNVGIVATDLTEMGDDKAHSTDATVSVLHIDEAEHKVDTLREGLPASLPALQVAAEHFSPFAVVNYKPATTPTLGVEFKMLDYDNDSRLDYRLKDVTVLDTAGNGISSMSIQVDSGYIDSIPDYAPGADSHDYKLFTDINANHLFYQIIFPTPLTPAEAKSFLENKLHFHLASQGANQQLTIRLGNGPSRFPQNATIKLTKATIPNPMPGDSAEHYYMYVEPQPKRLISWAESYNLAKQTYLDGMQGYLVTVTSAAEDNILNQVTATNIGAWSGGARFEGINDSDSVPNWTDNLAPGRTAGSVFANQSLSGSTGSGAHRRFRWQNGPETGIEYYEQGNGGSTPTGNGHALNTPYGIYSHFEPTGGMTYEPNSSGGMHGGPYVSGYESVMQVHNAGHWNDLHNVSEYTGGGLDVKGFYIEFSGYKRTGSTSEQVVPLHTASTVYAERNGQRYYFQTADEAVTWAGQNGNAPLTLIGDTTLTGDIPANVSLDLNGHTLTVPAGSSVVKQGYTFEGWYDNAALLGTPVTTLRTMDAENKQYYAKWSAPQQYPVRYVLNDSAANSATVPASNLLRYSVETNGGGAIHLNPAFRQGFDFLGWYDNAAFAGAPVADFPATDAVPKTYYAKWQIKSYWLQYYLNGGSGSNMPINPAVNPDRYTIEGEVSLAPPQRQGYTGIWSENGQTVTNIPAGSTGDRTLTAIWTLNRYPIHYELGETVNSCVEGLPALPQSYTAEDVGFTLPTPHRIGYIFLRWEKSGAPGVADNRIQASSAGELTFRAIWELIRYRIRYDTAGGVNNTQNPTEFTIEDEISPYGSVKQGMRF